MRSLQAAWPHTRITWLIGRTEYGLLAGLEGVEFITFDKREMSKSLLGIRRALAGRRFPALLHMQASMRANLVSLQVRAERRIGFDRARARDQQWLFTNERIPPHTHQHVMDGLFEFAAHLGVARRTLRWDIPVAQADRDFAAAVTAGDGPVCVISPCSSQRLRNFRNWSAANYAAVARGLLERRGARIVLTGGPTGLERAYGEEIAAAGPPLTNLIGRTTLKQLLALIAAADVVICPDSGPAHMATAVGTPVVGLYATSNRQRTGPWRFQDLVVDAYPEAVRREFGRPAEALRFGRRVRDPDAMGLITVDAVLANAERALDGAFASPDAGGR